MKGLSPSWVLLLTSVWVSHHQPSPVHSERSCASSIPKVQLCSLSVAVPPGYSDYGHASSIPRMHLCFHSTQNEAVLPKYSALPCSISLIVFVHLEIRTFLHTKHDPWEAHVFAEIPLERTRLMKSAQPDAVAVSGKTKQFHAGCAHMSFKGIRMPCPFSMPVQMHVTKLIPKGFDCFVAIVRLSCSSCHLTGSFLCTSH
jgi:hypothetical protein